MKTCSRMWMGNLDEKVIVKTKHGELTLEKLAEHEQKVTITILKAGGTLRPKYHQDISSFIQSHLHPLSESIKAKDWETFEHCYKSAVDEANKLHEKYGYGFIHYKLSKNPPDYYDLNPRD